MTKINKSDQIRAKLDQSEAQLRNAPAERRRDADPPEQFSSLVAEYPGLAIAAGLGIGLLAGALLPRSAGRKLARGALFVASTGSELGLAFGKQALHKAGEVTREGREKLGESATEAAHKAAEAGRKAADVGREAGSKAQQFAGDASERVRDVGLGLAKLAADAAARLRH